MDGFIKMSRYAGMREDLVQAGGGNSSYKLDNNKMLIKASGYQLAELTENDGYAMVDYQKIRNNFLNYTHLDNMTEKESNQILRDAYIRGEKPSIETFLHAISGKYTLHTHPVVINALTCRQGGMEILAELFPQALIVPYATPGAELAKKFFGEYKKKTGLEEKIFDVVFLQNHGLVVSGETAEKVIEKTEYIVQKTEEYLSVDYGSYHRLTELWKYFPEKIVWKVTDENVTKAITKMGEEWNYTFCPDCVVFLGKRILKLQDHFFAAEIEKFRDSYGHPVIVYWQENYYILADTVKKAMEIQSVMSFAAQVMLLNMNQKCVFLTDLEQNFLLNWDAEKYRKNMK